MARPSSKTASARGAVRQPTRWTRRRIGVALGVLFAAGLTAAVLDLRFVIGGAAREVVPNSLLVVDAKTLDTVRNTKAPGPRQPAVARGAGLLWTVDPDSNHVRGTNPVSGRVVRDEVVGTGPVAVAIGFGSAWVANAENGSVTVIPLTNGPIETIGLDEQPSGIATGSGYVWVVSTRGSKLLRIDPKALEVDRTLKLANPPLGVSAADGRVDLAIGD